MVIKVGINGFGRIGRVILRTCLENADVEVSAINDPAVDAEYICYLIKFDSTHGKFNRNIRHSQDEIQIDGSCIKLFHHKQPSSVPWEVAGVQFVVEASGMFTNLEKASGHLAREKVQRVIVTAPSVDVPMIILGVNDDKLNTDVKVMSCASSTLCCLAPIVKILEDNYGIVEGFVTSIHAMTPSLKPLDGLCVKGKIQQWRDHRSIHQNIIPAITGACKALGKIVPQAKDKLMGLAFRVPIVNVSVLDLTVRLNKNTTMEHIISLVKREEVTKMHNIITTSTEQVVSSDFIGDSHSCNLDIISSLQLKPNFYKLVCWYENEYSYACRVLESIIFSEQQFTKSELECNMPNVRPTVSWKPNIALQTESQEETFTSPRPYLNKTKEIHQDITQTLFNSAQQLFLKTNSVSNTQTESVYSSSYSLHTKRKKPPDFMLQPIRITPYSLEHHKTDVDHQPTKLNSKFDHLEKKVSLHILKKGTELLNKVASAKHLNSRDTCEVFKIWQDGEKDKTKSKQNTEALHKSCNSCVSGTKENNDFLKALESVKKEFSKTVNITEDLLKKSRSNKVQYESWAVSAITEVCNENAKNNFKTKNNNKLENFYGNSVKGFDDLSELVVDCNDNKKNIMAKCENNQKFNKEHTNLIWSSKGNTIPEESGIYVEFVEKDFREQNQDNIYNNNRKTHNVGNHYCTTVAVDKMPTTSDTLISSLQKIKISQSESNKRLQHKKNELFSMFTTNNKDYVQEFNCVKKGKHSSEYTDKQISKKEQNKSKLLIASTNSYEKDQDIKVHFNVLRDGPGKNNSTSINNAVVAHIDNNSIILPAITNNAHSRNFNNLTESLSDLSSLSNRISRSQNLVPRITNTTIDTESRDQDIFDKLDSASVTDSENSFQANEKASQVINIADLSSSMEDLIQLDKICRIIEISDDLSDELFSSLNHHNCSTVDKKEWSFKDLCDRIKLEDFCNKVFGKSSA